MRIIHNNRLEIHAEEGQLNFSLTRTFDAPKELVFKAYSEAELIKQWWGGASDDDIIVDKLEAHAGGSWRFVETGKDENGNDVEYAFHGVYHQFSLDEGIVQTFEFEGMPGHVLMETIRFEEKEGKTTIHSISVFQTQEDRDGMMASGMEYGANKSYNQLEELLKSM